jgi:hypothetical protein
LSTKNLRQFNRPKRSRLMKRNSLFAPLRAPRLARRFRPTSPPSSCPLNDPGSPRPSLLGRGAGGEGWNVRAATWHGKPVGQGLPAFP